MRRRPRSQPSPSRQIPRSDSAGVSVGPVRQQPLAHDPAAPIGAVYLKTPTRSPVIYRKRIDGVEHAKPGDLVAVYAGDELLGYGLYNPRSEIGVRMVRHGQELPDDAFWDAKLRAAVGLRRELLRLDDSTNAYRLIHAESDGFPGLVVDRIGDVLSAEAYNLGMYQRAADVLARLAPLCGTTQTLFRPSPQFLSQEGSEPPPVASDDLPSEVTIQEFGTRFRVRFEGGHKTGFFCDQRDNRRRLAELCRDRTVLDLCCYTGGFAVQAKRLGGAAEVIGVDLDEAPLELARENANLNQVRVRFVAADAFNYMRDMLQGGRRFDVVVLDPPKLVRSRQEVEEGIRKHLDLNRLAMQLVAPGGLMLTCCCSGLISEAEFLKLVLTAARQSGELVEAATAERGARHAPRPVQILARTGAAADHPVAAAFPETEYLKAVWLRME